MFGKSFTSYNVTFEWDNEALVWIAASNDIPGLVLESESFDTLIERVKITVPELLELNGMPPCTEIIFKAERCEKL